MNNAIIAKLQKAGFKANVHGFDAYDRGDYRVFLRDTELAIVKFNNPVSQLIEWQTSLSTNMPEDKLLTAIEVLTA